MSSGFKNRVTIIYMSLTYPGKRNTRVFYYSSYREAGQNRVRGNEDCL